MNAMNSIPYTDPWIPGDVIGIGLKYIGKNKYKIFLTKNGVIENQEKTFETEEYLFPMMAFDLSCPVQVNFGDKPFKFNLDSYIQSNEIFNDIVSCVLKKSCKDPFP